jgi:hypothetical protein
LFARLEASNHAVSVKNPTPSQNKTSFESAIVYFRAWSDCTQMRAHLRKETAATMNVLTKPPTSNPRRAAPLRGPQDRTEGAAARLAKTTPL